MLVVFLKCCECTQTQYDYHTLPPTLCSEGSKGEHPPAVLMADIQYLHK